MPNGTTTTSGGGLGNTDNTRLYYLKDNTTVSLRRKYFKTAGVAAALALASCCSFNNSYHSITTIPCINYLLAFCLVWPIWVPLLLLEQALWYYSISITHNLAKASNVPSIICGSVRIGLWAAIVTCSVELALYLLDEQSLRYAVTAMVAAALLIVSYVITIFQWWQNVVRVRGIIPYLPSYFQTLLLETSPVQWLTSSSVVDDVWRFYPFLFQLDADEKRRAIKQFPASLRSLLDRKGMINIVPSPLKKMLLPKKINNSGSRSGFTFDAAERQEEEDKRRRVKNSREEDVDTMLIPSLIHNRVMRAMFGQWADTNSKSTRQMAVISLIIIVVQLSTASKKTRMAFFYLVRILLSTSAGGLAVSILLPQLACTPTSWSTIARRLMLHSTRQVQEKVMGQPVRATTIVTTTCLLVLWYLKGRRGRFTK